MKARVKATGEYIEVAPSIYDKGCYDGNDGYTYTEESLIMFENEPDYWTKLHHQAAIAAMQGMLSNSDYIERFTAHTVDGIACVDSLTSYANDYATALVNRLEEESQCEK